MKFNYKKEINKEVIVLLLLIGILGLIYTPYVLHKNGGNWGFMKGDTYYYRAMIESMIKDGDLLMENNVWGNPYSGDLSIGPKGIVPKHSILMSVLSIPFYFLFENYGLLIFNIIFSIILMTLIYWLNRFFFNKWLSFSITIIYATTTLFLSYSYNYSPDVFSSVFILLAINLAFRNYYKWAGVLSGIAVFAKVTNIFPAILIEMYIIFQILFENQDKKERLSKKKFYLAIAPILVFCLALTPFLATNYYLYGSPITTGYQCIIYNGPLSPVPGVVNVRNQINEFNQPFFVNLKQTLFHPSIGIIPTNPVIILAFLGIFFMIFYKKWRSKLILLLSICLIQLIFFTRFNDWWASEYSNRYLMTLVALSSVFTSLFLLNLKKFLQRMIDAINKSKLEIFLHKMIIKKRKKLVLKLRYISKRKIL